MSLKKENEEIKDDEVRRVIERVYRAFEELDARKLDENFSHSSELLAFGTDWDEKFAGWQEYKDVHTVQFSALRSFKFTARELSVHVHDGVAWAADRPHWEIETKSGEHISNDVRITAVLKREERDGVWQIIQWHVSVGLGERLHEY